MPLGHESPWFEADCPNSFLTLTLGRDAMRRYRAHEGALARIIPRGCYVKRLMNFELPFVRKMRRLACWERTFSRKPLANTKTSANPGGQQTHRVGLTLVEMLIAMAIALLMMAAVVTVFANISASVTRRRATIEMSGQLRGAREILSRDLEGATCPAIPWQKPDAANGYFELIEGPLNDSMPSVWLWDSGDADEGLPDGLGRIPTELAQLDLGLSFLPGSNLRDSATSTDEEGRGIALGSNEDLDPDFKTDGRGLGDGDDILMLTVRNESDEFVGRVPPRIGEGSPNTERFPDWGTETIESPLAEVIWFAVENPPERNTTFAFGEPGFRTVYRRSLLIAPWLEYRIRVTASGSGTIVTKAGVVRVLIDRLGREDVAQALASLISFQERYDLSVRLEWDPLLPSSDDEGRWVLKANSLADLTKRENRYEHHGFVFNSPSSRQYPYALASFGSGYGTNESVEFVIDPEYTATGPSTDANFDAIVVSGSVGSGVLDYQPDSADALNDILNPARVYPVRPFAYVNANGTTTATARAWQNETGNVVYVTRGLVPLSGVRQGEDIVMTDVLAFDLRVYDPGAPLYGYYPQGYDGGVNQQEADIIVQPGDAAWLPAVLDDFANGTSAIQSNLGDLAGNSGGPTFRWERNGAYVDLGYDRTFFNTDGLIDSPFNRSYISFLVTNEIATANPVGVSQSPSFFKDGALKSTSFFDLAPGYSVYDTWSWHYENNGMDEDLDGLTDEAVNGFDEVDITAGIQQYGADDPSERETRPPYDTALRGVQAKIRVYERDSRQIRETTIRESFVPE